MPRLTPDEKLNLSRNMKKLNKKYNYSNKDVSLKTGIPRRTYETYLYCEKGASSKNLDILASFYGVSRQMLLSSGINTTNTSSTIISANTDRNKPVTLFDRITGIIDEIIGSHIYSGLLYFIKRLGFNIEYRPILISEEINEYETAKHNAGKTTKNFKMEALTKQLNGTMPMPSKTFTMPDGQVIEKTDEEYNKQLSSYESTKKTMELLKDFFKNNAQSIVDNRIACELFIEKYINGDFDDTPIKDIPLEIVFTQPPECLDINLARHETYDFIVDYSNDFTLDEFLDLLYEIEKMLLDKLVSFD